MAKNAPAGDGQRKGMVRKRSQRKTKIEGEEHWTKRDASTGQFMDQKADEGKFKGVRREKKKLGHPRRTPKNRAALLRRSFANW